MAYRNSLHIIRLLLFSLCLMTVGCQSAWAASESDESATRGATYKHISLGRDSYNFWSHFSLSTNFVDWALVIPNLGLEIDLGNPERMSTQTVGFQFKGSPASRDYLAEGLYDQTSYRFWDARFDWRFHFTFGRHPERFKGRFYAGLYAEYMDYTLCTPIDLFDRNALKDGDAIIGGLAGGYEFPGFSYGNRHFFQFQVGGSLGIIHADYKAYTADGFQKQVRTFPMLTELRFALTYRNHTISRKYWQPNLERYRRQKAEDEFARQQLERIVDSMDDDPVTIYVKHAPGLDSVFLQPITFNQIRQAFHYRFPSPYLRTEDIYEIPENTAFPITKPSENYRVGYSMEMRGDYDSDDTELHYVFPFRVRLEGYDEALARQMSFNQCLRDYYYNNEKHLPSMMVPAINRDEFTTSATIDNVLTLLNEKWTEGNIDRSEVTGVYFRQDGEFIPIKEDEMTRRGTYALGLRFHHQVSEAYDTLATRFNLEPYVDDEVQNMFENFLGASTTNQFYIDNPWRNGKERVITKRDIIQALAKEGYDGFSEENIEVEDTIHYGRNVGTAFFGNILPELRFVYVVEDSVGLRLGNKFHQAIQRGIEPRRAFWKEDVPFNNTYGPLCKGKYDADGQLVPADRNEVLSNVMRFLIRCNPELKDQHIDPIWVENYTYSGVHEIPNGRPQNRWTILRFAYRFIASDGRSRIAYAHVAYRLKMSSR